MFRRTLVIAFAFNGNCHRREKGHLVRFPNWILSYNPVSLADIKVGGPVYQLIGNVPWITFNYFLNCRVDFSRPIDRSMQLYHLVVVVSNVIWKPLNVDANGGKCFFEHSVIVKSDQTGSLFHFAPALN